jgi:hypothetical protein
MSSSSARGHANQYRYRTDDTATVLTDNRYLAVLSTRTYLERRSGTYCRPITDSGTPCSSSPEDRRNREIFIARTFNIL